LQKGRAFDRCSGHRARSYRTSFDPEGADELALPQELAPAEPVIRPAFIAISLDRLFSLGQRESFFLGI
jgi:hypothetical protein